ncbi:MAG: hypothetical protein RXR02_09535 [Thermoproteus sp.]
MSYGYMVEVYVAKDGSEACISLMKAYCARDGAVREAKLEFSGLEVYEKEIRRAYRPKGLLASTTTAKEYVRIL